MNRHQAAGIALTYGTAAALFGALHAGNKPAIAALAVIVAAFATSAAHDHICVRLSGWCVYGLYNERGDLIYIGSTNDLYRRILEHTDDVETEPWRRTISGYVELRNCHSEGQARRIERRRIKAAIVAANTNRAVKINNDLHTRPTRSLPAHCWFTALMAAYLVESIAFAGKRWLDNQYANPVPHRPDSVDSDDDPEPVDPDDSAPPRTRRTTVIQATYERRSQTPPEHGSGECHALALWTPDDPSRKSRSHAHQDPFRGPGADAGQRDAHGSPSGSRVTLSDRIRAAHAHQTQTTRTQGQKARSKATSDDRPKLTDEERAAVKREQAAERKRRQRARQRNPHS